LKLKRKNDTTDKESMQQSITDILSQQNYEYQLALQQDIAREEMEEREERERKAKEHERNKDQENKNQHLSESEDDEENPSPKTLREKRQLFFAKLTQSEPLPNEPLPNEPLPNEPLPNEPLPNEPLKKRLRSGRTY